MTAISPRVWVRAEGVTNTHGSHRNTLRRMKCVTSLPFHLGRRVKLSFDWRPKAARSTTAAVTSSPQGPSSILAAQRSKDKLQLRGRTDWREDGMSAVMYYNRKAPTGFKSNMCACKTWGNTSSGASASGASVTQRPVTGPSGAVVRLSARDCPGVWCTLRVFWSC